MNKIHAIKCPQCGSPEKIAIKDKENHYKCASCETEYFLETNDIRHYHYDVKDKDSNYWGFSWKIIFIILVAIVLFYIKDNTTKRINTTQAQYSPSKVENLANEINKEKVGWHYTENSRFILNKKNEPILILLGYYVYNTMNLNNKPIDVQFINMHTKEISKIQQLPNLNKISNSTNIKIKKFKTGEYYAIQEEKIAYLIDPESQRFLPINEEFAKQQPELSKGILKIKFSSRYGDGFDIMLPNGKNYLYFPYSNLLINDNKAFDYVYQPNKNKAPKDAPEIKTIDFTASLFFGRNIGMNTDDKIKLVEYIQKTPYGYPMISPSFYDLLKKDRGVPNFLSKKDMADARISKWRDITPDRDYFSPALFCHNNQYGLISFSENVLMDSTRYIQLLELKTGEPIWTREYNIGRQSIQFMKLSCEIDQSGTAYIFDIRHNKLSILNVKGEIIGEKKWD